MGRQTEEDDNATAHGSWVLSKAVGRVNGVFKADAGLEIIKATGSRTDLDWAFDTVLQKVRLRPSEPVVVLYPWASPETDREQDYPWTVIKPTVQQIFEHDAVVIVPAGNYAQGGRRKVDALPARWASPTFPLIVAGSVSNPGAYSYFTQGGDRVTAWAPGLEVQCADQGRTFAKRSGTSHSTGMVRPSRSKSPY